MSTYFAYNYNFLLHVVCVCVYGWVFLLFWNFHAGNEGNFTPFKLLCIGFFLLILLCLPFLIHFVFICFFCSWCCCWWRWCFYFLSFSYIGVLFLLLLFQILFHFIKYSTLPNKLSPFPKETILPLFFKLQIRLSSEPDQLKHSHFCLSDEWVPKKYLKWRNLRGSEESTGNVFRVLLIQSANSKIQSSQ